MQLSASFLSCFTLLFNGTLHTVVMHPSKHVLNEDVKLVFLVNDDDKEIV